MDENNKNNKNNKNDPVDSRKNENGDFNLFSPPTPNLRNEKSEKINFDADAETKIVPKTKEKKSKAPVVIIIVIAAAIIAGAVIFVLTTRENKTPEEEITTKDSEEILEDLQDMFNDTVTEEYTDENGDVIPFEEYAEQVKQDAQEATTTLNANVGAESPNKIEAPAQQENNNKVPEGTKTENQEELDKSEDQIKAFFDRTCFMQGAMYADGEGSPLSLAFDGNNIEAQTNIDGIEVSILQIDGVTYLKRSATKQYVEFTESVMQMMGIDPSDLVLDFGATSYEDVQNKLSSTYDVTINGEKGVCREYANGFIYRFYTVGGEIKEIDICREDGTVDTQISLNYFSESIPSDQLTLKGYEEATIGTMFADIIAEDADNGNDEQNNSPDNGNGGAV